MHCLHAKAVHLDASRHTIAKLDAAISMILIVTAEDDLHAVSICQRVQQLGYANCHIIEADRLAQRETLSFSLATATPFDWIEDIHQTRVAVSDADIIWLRRFRSQQRLRVPLSDEAAAQIVHNDCRGAIGGLLATKFDGRWISHPEASIRASDKIFQLTAAMKHGFRVPKTLVSQSADDIQRFFEECNGSIIVKSVVGVSEPFLRTIRLTSLDSFTSEEFAASPAIYQEYIEGSQHLRLLSFGKHSLCGVIRTEEVDWRPNLNVEIQPWEVPHELNERVSRTLGELGLEMGIVDIKIDAKGEHVWFEVNPQGQFLFLEPLTKINFIDEFAKFLIASAKEVASSH